MTTEPDAKLIEQGRKLFAGDWQFFWASPSIETLPPMAGMEVAFAGRSNVGKSSLINALTGRNALARTSHTPGRTQELIFFEGPDNAGFRLVDMPGYGYASAPKAKVASWTALIHKFLPGRSNLARVYVLIDARHGLKEVDLDVLNTLDKSAVSYQVVLTKADQVKSAELRAAHRGRRGRACKTSRGLSGSSGDVLAHRRRDAGIARRNGAPAGRAKLMDGLRGLRILIILAGVMGADGVILAAASAHQPDATRLAAASSMLLFHSAGRACGGGAGRARHYPFPDRDRGRMRLCHRGRAVRGRPQLAAICRPRPVPFCRADRRHASDCELAYARGGGGMAAAGVRSRFSSLLPLWEKVAREARRMRGLYPRRQTPHPSTMLRIAATLSHKGRGEKPSASLRRARQSDRNRPTLPTVRPAS